MAYRIEAQAPTLQAIVTCGSRPGYHGMAAATFDEVAGHLHRIHSSLEREGRQPIPCFLTEGRVLGRTGGGAYAEQTYEIKFFWSPRADPRDPAEFLDTVGHYAAMLGERLQQERVYVDFAGTTRVLHRSI